MAITAIEMTPNGKRPPLDLDRRIPIALVFGFLLQTGGALFWAGAAAERIAEVERETRANSAVIERVVRLEAEVEAAHEALARIEMKIDRMAPKAPGARQILRRSAAHRGGHGGSGRPAFGGGAR